MADTTRQKKLPAHRVLHALMGEQWLMLEDRLAQMADIALRLNDAPEAVAAKLGRPLDNTRSVTIRDGVAVIPITGPIFRYANLFTEISGATSVDVLARDLDAAASDPAVSGIVLEIDSPGGQAAGVSDMAAIIRAVDKPVVAYVDNQAASAAYWFAAGAGEIVIAKTAMLGSVGVVVTAETKKADGTIQIVSSQSPRKRPDPATEAGKAQIQTIIDDLAQVFVEDVAALRAISVDTVLSWEGDMLVGQKAVDAGMADRVGDLESIIAGLSGSTKRTFAMSNGKSSPEITRDSIAAEHPAIADALRAEGREALLSDAKTLLALPVVAEAIAEARTAGAEAERGRIQSVQEQASGMPGHADLITGLMFDGHTTGPEAAVKILAAEKQKRVDAGKELAGDVPAPVPSVASQEGGQSTDANLPVEQRAQAQWDKSPDLRTEFGGNFNSYLAFVKAEESGRVRRIGGKQK